MAGALLTHAPTVFREQGYQRASISVDAGSPTGAPLVYRRAGFTLEQTWAVYALREPAG